MNFKIRKPHDPHGRVKQHIGERSRTQQHLRDETDINHIMRKYEKTGILTHVARYAGEYGDFSGVPDYKTGIERIQAAEDMFMSLPARIREKFQNDPGKFIDFATNPENQAELRTLGLAPPEPPVAERSKLVAEGGSEPPKEAKKSPDPA